MTGDDAAPEVPARGASPAAARVGGPRSAGLGALHPVGRLVPFRLVSTATPVPSSGRKLAGRPLPAPRHYGAGEPFLQRIRTPATG